MYRRELQQRRGLANTVILELSDSVVTALSLAVSFGSNSSINISEEGGVLLAKQVPILSAANLLSKQKGFVLPT